jgi:hypothetical protein
MASYELPSYQLPAGGSMTHGIRHSGTQRKHDGTPPVMGVERTLLLSPLIFSAGFAQTRRVV